jgi:multidrug efflux pump subunit AcrA (membrane-fusion protein)
MKTKKTWRIILILGIALALAAAGFYFYKNQPSSAQAPEEPALQTATVRRGDLVISATGAGTVISAADASLGFTNGGLLVELPVQVGSKVHAGDVLARVDDTDAASAVEQAQLSLDQAQLQVDQLKEAPTPAELASAQAALASAQATLQSRQKPGSNPEIAAARQSLASAQAKLDELLAGPSNEDMTTAQANLKLAEIDVQTAQTDYDKVSWRPEIGTLPQSAALQTATLAYEKAKAAYNAATEGASDSEIASARASVAQAQSSLNSLLNGSTAEEIAAAQASVDQAQAQLADLTDGASQIDLKLAQIAVRQAELSLTTAQEQLAETILTAPFTGTVMSIDANLGERVGGTSFIGLANIDKPWVEVYLDETDLDKVGIDYEAEVTFDALPDQVFTGHVTQVDPELTNSNGVTAVRAVIQLDADSFSKPQTLPIGLNASVDVIGGRATQALLVPVEALREISTGSYAVFVVKDGKPTLAMVEVGLMDLTYAEITSGLNQGDVVTTGIVETN